MGNALKAVATGGLSLLPGKVGDVAGSVATGVPFGWGRDNKRGRPVPPLGTPPGGVLGKRMPGYGPMQEGGFEGGPPGLISKLVGAVGGGGFESPAIQGPAPVEEPIETPRQRAARQAEQKAARGNQRTLPVGRVNPTEVNRKQMVTNKLRTF